MKLWILRPLIGNNTAWRPWYDKCFGMVVRAESEKIAREICARKAWDEWDPDEFGTLDKSVLNAPIPE